MSGQQKSEYAEILLSCIEDSYYKEEMALEFHSFARVVSGEMKVIQADNTYTFTAGDTLIFPANQLSTLIKSPKDGLPYKAVVIFFTPERLKAFYTKNPGKRTAPHTHKIKTFAKHPMLESFFASLIPYFDLESELPEKIMAIKIEEALTILRTIDKDIDQLMVDFSEPHKINLAAFMEKNYMHNLTMEKFGHLTGRSLTTFKRDFKKSFNTTPKKMVTPKKTGACPLPIIPKKAKPN